MLTEQNGKLNCESSAARLQHSHAIVIIYILKGSGYKHAIYLKTK